VRLWDVATDALVGSLTGHTDAVDSVAFSPDGKTLASGSWDKSVRLWDVATRHQIGFPLSGHTDAVDSVAFSPDSKTLTSGSSDNSVRLWDVATQHQIGSPLTGHIDAVLSLAFSPDGKTLITGSKDNSVGLWSVPHLADPAAFLCQSVGQSPTRNQWQKLIPEGPKRRPLCP
jgi:WD40 repeat protein